ncbi:MAG: hypothetical protein Ta2F_12720 [Termitinemataceae bacterium]|nr:MAG: hypothetical protein Ta2F_12720 [Termitinemataceae bacterium]
MKKLFALVFIVPFFFSCIGTQTKVTLKKDGSGTVIIKYFVSEQFASLLSTQDGTDKTLPVPLEKSDFEQVIKRIDGLTLNSFKTSNTEKDRVISIDMSFAKIESLIAFLDYQGLNCSYGKDNGKNTLALLFTYSSDMLRDDVKNMIPYVFAGYEMDFSLVLPSDVELRYIDKTGKTVDTIPAGTITNKNKVVRFVSPMADLLSSAKPVAVELTW